MLSASTVQGSGNQCSSRLVPFPDAVHDRVAARLPERGQNTVPGAAIQVDRLSGLADECLQVDRLAILVVSDDNQHRHTVQRYEGLTAFRVSLDHVDDIGNDRALASNRLMPARPSPKSSFARS